MTSFTLKSGETKVLKIGESFKSFDEWKEFKELLEFEFKLKLSSKVTKKLTSLPYFESVQKYASYNTGVMYHSINYKCSHQGPKKKGYVRPIK